MYFLLLICCYAVSILPFRLLYVLSDGLYLILYHIIGYRKDVVMQNLQQAFPGKTENERLLIAKKYYRNLTDMTLETIKLLTISKSELQKRFVCDLGILHELHRQGKTSQIHLGHLFNWEWANPYFTIGVEDPFLVVYMPVSSRAVDRLMMKIRSRFGTIMISAANVQPAMQPWQGKPFIQVLVADQNPANPRRCYWSPFLGKMTAFYKGPELSARRGNFAVVFGDIKKLKRGYYHATTTLAFADSQQTKEGEITEAFVRFLENGILRQPEVWVWSHRRWKHEVAN